MVHLFLDSPKPSWAPTHSQEKVPCNCPRLPPCPPPAHPVSYTDSSLLVTQVSQVSILWTEAQSYAARESQWKKNSALDFAICIISKINLARENREATYIKVLSSLPRTRIILRTRNQDSVQVWSLNHEHQHHLGIARSAKPQALPQIY